MVETLEYFIDSAKDVEISHDNHLCGRIGDYCGRDTVKFKIPLPEGYWIILHNGDNLIRIGKY